MGSNSTLTSTFKIMNTFIGGKVSNLPSMDGLDMWRTLSEDESATSPRNLMLHNIDESRLISAVRVGDWKLVKGKSWKKDFVRVYTSNFFLNLGTTYHGEWDGHYGPSGRDRSLKYDFNKVVSSPAAKALRSIGSAFPSKAKIKALREEAEVKCTKRK